MIIFSNDSKNRYHSIAYICYTMVNLFTEMYDNVNKTATKFRKENLKNKK